MSTERDQQVYALFEEALRHDPAGRRALLDDRCAADAELRAEVEGLLSWDDEAERDGFLTPATPSATDSAGHVPYPGLLRALASLWLCPDSTVRPELGPAGTSSQRGGSRRLGRFELVEAVGAGAFGTVYRARDPQLDRTVAIKVLRAGSLATDEDRARFLREARSVAQLRHPAIVPVHEVGEDDDIPFLVSEFVQGKTLAERLASDRLSPEESARLVAEVAQALDYAHECGVVHRDVKPSNILLDRDGRPHLTDFGLARRDAAEITMTIEGQLLGTPAYMSPEQAHGEAHQVDGRCDVYSLGVILYELLSGEPPFRGSLRMVLQQVRHDEPRPLRKLDNRLPRDLETICAKAMAKHPQRRYATAGDLAADLRRFLGGEPIRARRTGAVEKTWRWCRRRPVVAGLSLGVLTGLVATSLAWVAALDARRDADRRRREAALAQARTREQEELSRQRLYDVQMTQVQRYWENYNGRLLRQTLDELLPENPRGDDRRGFEWFYWRRKLSSGHRSLETDGGPVTTLAFSPDGRQIAGASPGARTVKLWDVASGRPARPLEWHSGGVTSVAFSPVRRQLATAGEDRTVKVGDLDTGQATLILNGHADRVMGVAFSLDGRRIASASDDRTVKVWDAADGRELLTLRGHTGAVWSVAFSPDGARLASGSAADSTVRVWDLASGRETLILKGHTGGDKSVAFSLDGSRIASASFLGSIVVWNATSGQEALRLEGHSDQVQSVAFSPDGNLLASAGDDGTVKIRVAATGQETGTLKGHTRWVRSVAFSPDGRVLASGSLDGELKVWDTVNGQETLTHQEPASDVQGLAFSPDGRRVAFGIVGGTVKCWDIAGSGEALALKGLGPPGHDWITAVAFSPDSRHIASSHLSGAVKVRDASTGQETVALEGHPGGATSVAFSPDGHRIASTGLGNQVCLWDAANGARTLTLQGPSGASASGLAFSPDGSHIATAGGDGRVRLWDTRSRRERLILTGSTHDAIGGVAFSPRGKLLASASRDTTVRVWAVATGELVLILRGHSSGVSGVAFSPDGRRIASASEDGTVKLWDTATGQETLTLKGHRKVDAVAFSPDGHRLASAGSQLVKVWDARPLDPAPTNAGVDRR